MLTHQTTSWEYQSHSDQFQPNLTSIYSQPSLPSVPSLTSETNHQNQLFESNKCLTTIRGHTSYISSLTLSGKFLYSGCSSKEIRSWKRYPLQCYDMDKENVINNVVAEGKGAVKSLVVLSDKLFSAHQDHKIRVWKINNHQEEGHEQERLIHLATLPTLSDRAWKLLSPKNQVPIRRHKTSTWVHHVDTVSALALSKDGTLLYSVSWDRTLKIWRTSDFKCMESIANAHDDAINAIVVSSNDGCVYTGSFDKRIKVWRRSSEDGKHYLVATLEKHNSGINALALSNDGSVLFSGACDRSIIVWEKDDENYVVKGALRGHTKSILCLFVVDDILFSGSADKSIRVWRSIGRVYSCLAVLEGHLGPVKCLTAAVDRPSSSETCYLLYSGSLDCDIKVWQIHVPFL